MDNAPRYSIYGFDEFRLDDHELMLYRDGREISLPPKAVKTLSVLVENRGSILTKDELIDQVWTDAVVEESNLSQYLYLLRKTLGNTSEGRPYIETFRRRGYRFNGEVRLIEAPPRTNGTSAAAPNGNAAPYEAERRGNVLRLVRRHEATKSADAGSSAPPKQFAAGKLAIAAAAFFAVLFASFLYFRTRPSEPALSGMHSRNDLTILRLTNGGAPWDATISPDGDYFVYHERDGDTYHLWLQQTGQSNRLEIIPPTGKMISGKTFSSDGQFVYFVVRGRSEAYASLYRIPTLGGAASKIIDDVNSPPSFSPDGKEMVFLRSNEKAGESSLIIASAAGDKERVLLSQPKEDGFLSSPAWSPNGNLISFGALNQQSADRPGWTINGINPQTGATETLSSERWDVIYRAIWSRDGAGLVFIGTKLGESYTTRRDQVYYLSYPSGEERRLTTDGDRYQTSSLGVTTSDEVIAVPDNRSSQIWRMDANGDSRTAVQITNGMADGRAGLVALADGRVGYIGRMGDTLKVWQMNADGTNQKQLYDDPPFIEELRSPPSGSFFVFSTWSGGSRLFRIDADGSNLRQLTPGDSHVTDSTVSPDGDWIVYEAVAFSGVSAKQSLWKIPGSGGEPVLLTDKECGTPHFSPDGKFISCVYQQREISIISAADGTVVKSFDALKDSTLNSGARWSPDGSALIYSVDQGNHSNLWRHPTDGGAPQPLTDFTSGDIYNFAFSTDGSCLYLARGNKVRDAVLIKNFK